MENQETKEITSETYYRAIRLQCGHSLWTLVRKGMGYTFVHSDSKDYVDWFQTKWNPLRPRRQNVLLQVARDTFKSTCITQSFPAWALEKNPNLAILIVSKTYTNAQNFLMAQKKRIESDIFKRVFGDWRNPRTWGEDRITVKQRTSHRREPSIMCGGINSEFTSMHFDIILLDDITTELDMYSDAERKRTERFIKTVYDLIDKRHGLIAIIGTLWHENDELEKIKKGNPKKIKDRILPYQIYSRPAEKLVDNKWVTTFKFLTREILRQIRRDKADIRNYSANYRLMPIPPETQIFSEFHYFKYTIDVYKECESLITFIDPALGDDKKSCYAPIITVGIRKSDRRLLTLRANVKRRKPTVLITDLRDEYKFLKQFQEYLTIMMYMESTLFQEFVKDEAINKSLLAGEYLPLSGYGQHKNKFMRITQMEKYTTSGQILFRDDWETAENDYRLVIDQLKIFTVDTKEPIDAPDCLEGCTAVVMQGAGLNISCI